MKNLQERVKKGKKKKSLFSFDYHALTVPLFNRWALT